MNDTGNANGPAGRLTTELVAQLRRAELTIACAESLTGGLLMATLSAEPGVSTVLRGGPVVYATDTKVSHLGIDAELLAERSPVDAEVARAMAVGVRERWGASIGIATTGVAGPDPQDGHPVGEVYVAAADAAGHVVERLSLKPAGGASDREQRALIRQETVVAALELALTRARECAGGERATGSRGGSPRLH